jgi:alpha-ketoglutarate-dependent taurine dioxygenase
VAVHYSPPIEGPLLLNGDPAQKQDYLVAYAAFERLVDDQLFVSDGEASALLSPDLDATCHQYALDYTWERSLVPGDNLVFNNQRMLHGRRGFEFLNGEANRYLVGCYTNIDDTINTFRLLHQSKRAHFWKWEQWGSLMMSIVLLVS